jgi:hypothetical protein
MNAHFRCPICAPTSFAAGALNSLGSVVTPRRREAFRPCEVGKLSEALTPRTDLIFLGSLHRLRLPAARRRRQPSCPSSRLRSSSRGLRSLVHDPAAVAEAVPDTSHAVTRGSMVSRFPEVCIEPKSFYPSVGTPPTRESATQRWDWLGQQSCSGSRRAGPSDAKAGAAALP